MAKNLTESQLEEYLGWVHGSQSPRTYVHLSGRDVDEKILQLHGLTNGVKRDEPTVKMCPFCHTLNASNMSVCHNCKRPLEIKAEDVISLEDELKNLKVKYEEQAKKIAELEARDAVRESYDERMTLFMRTVLDNPKIIDELAKKGVNLK